MGQGYFMVCLMAHMPYMLKMMMAKWWKHREVPRSPDLQRPMTSRRDSAWAIRIPHI